MWMLGCWVMIMCFDLILCIFLFGELCIVWFLIFGWNIIYWILQNSVCMGNVDGRLYCSRNIKKMQQISDGFRQLSGYIFPTASDKCRNPSEAVENMNDEMCRKPSEILHPDTLFSTAFSDDFRWPPTVFCRRKMPFSL